MTTFAYHLFVATFTTVIGSDLRIINTYNSIISAVKVLFAMKYGTNMDSQSYMFS